MAVHKNVGRYISQLVVVLFPSS